MVVDFVPRAGEVLIFSVKGDVACGSSCTFALFASEVLFMLVKSSQNQNLKLRICCIQQRSQVLWLFLAFFPAGAPHG